MTATLTLTAAELHTIAANSSAPEHLYLWNDGADTWTIDNLSDIIEDEALEGMGSDSTITLTADGLSEAGEAEYVRGFCAAAPDWYTGEDGCPIDSDASTPWCAPWIVGHDFIDHSLTPYEMGQRDAAEHREAMEALRLSALGYVNDEEGDA